jgi:hypothetical protein
VERSLLGVGKRVDSRGHQRPNAVGDHRFDFGAARGRHLLDDVASELLAEERIPLGSGRDPLAPVSAHGG